LALFFSVALVGGARAAQYSIVDLGPLPGGGFAEALNVNDRGQIVGQGSTATGERHAILWNNGEAIDLGTLGGTSSAAWGINDRGQIVGGSDTATGEYHAFLWQDGQMINLAEAGNFNVAFAINHRSEAVGEAPSSATFGTTGVLWRKETVIDLGIRLATDVNDHSVVVGVDVTALRAVLWKAGQVTELGTLPGGTSSVARSINKRGQVVGESTVDGVVHGFVWDDGRMEALGDLIPSGASFARDINKHGQIVGQSVSDPNVVGGAPHPELWHEGVPIDLGTLPDDPESSAAAINDHGVIVGFSGGPTQGFPTHAVAWTPRR
jgi:probable HAF family extracellular repeat protein